jgi:hypothetical protein
MSTTQKHCCKREIDGGMIGCDRCDGWFHFACVGLKCAPGEDEDWICQSPACQMEAADWVQTRKRNREEGEEEEEEEAEEEEDEKPLCDLLAGDDDEEWHPFGAEHGGVITEEDDEEQVEQEPMAQVSDDEIEEEQKELVSDRKSEEHENVWQSPDREPLPSPPPAVPPPPAAAGGEQTTPCIDTWRAGRDIEFDPVVLQLVLFNMARPKDNAVMIQGKANQLKIERPALLFSDGEQTARATIPTFSPMLDTFRQFDVVQLSSYATGSPSFSIHWTITAYSLPIHSRLVPSFSICHCGLFTTDSLPIHCLFTV